MSISCEVCYEPYLELPCDRRPRALPLCGHDFCTRCIASLCATERRPVCPKCRTPLFHDEEMLLRKLPSNDEHQINNDNHDNEQRQSEQNENQIETQIETQQQLPSAKFISEDYTNSYLKWPVLRCLLQLDERLDFGGVSLNNNNNNQAMKLLERALQAAPTVLLQIELDQRKKREFLEQLPTDLLQQEINKRTSAMVTQLNNFSPNMFGATIIPSAQIATYPFSFYTNSQGLFPSVDGSTSPSTYQQGRSTTPLSYCCCNRGCQQSASLTQMQSTALPQIYHSTTIPNVSPNPFHYIYARINSDQPLANSNNNVIHHQNSVMAEFSHLVPMIQIPNSFPQYPMSWSTTGASPMGNHHLCDRYGLHRRTTEVFFQYLCALLCHVFIGCVCGIGSAIRRTFIFFKNIRREQRLQLVMIANAIPLLIGSFYVFHNPTFFVQLRATATHA